MISGFVFFGILMLLVFFGVTLYEELGKPQ